MVLCIALVVGANSAVFSVVDALMLRVVPADDPERLVALSSVHTSPDLEPEEASVSPKDFAAWREQARSFSAVVGVYPRNFNLATASEGGLGEGDALEPEHVEGALVSPGLFALLGVQPAQGRSFTAEDERPGGEKLAVLSDRLWRRRFGADPEVVDTTFLVDGAATRIIGVMPPGFRYPGDSEMWGPHIIDPAAPTYEWHYLSPVARLAPGIRVEQAKSELINIAQRLAEDLPQTNAGWSATVEPLADRLVGDMKPRLLALSAGVGFLLLIACANIANLLLARATARSKEMAVRSAMGSSKPRLLALVLVEGILLALAGGAVGLLFTRLSILLVTRVPLDIPALDDVALDLRVLGFTLLIALVTGLLFSLAPALRLMRLDPQPYLKEGARGSTIGAHGHRLQGVFVVVQVAVTVVLLASAALLLQSLNALQGVDPGFDPQGLLTMRVSLPESRYPGTPERARFADQVVERLGSLPGVRSAALTTALPIGDRDVDFSAAFSIEGRIPSDAGSEYLATVRRVTPSFFETLGVPLLEGRGFTAADHADAPGVVIVSRTMADRYWPGESPLGKRLKLGDYGSSSPWLTVVGIVGDVKDDGLQLELEPIWYRPYAQHENKSARYVALLVRSDMDPSALLRPVRREVRSMDSQLPLYNVATMDELLAASLAQHHVVTLVIGALSFLGLAIAAIGLYGVMSYVVNQRRQEIGIRMAMGARRGDVLGLVLKRGMLLAGSGMILGFGGLVLLARLLSSLLYGVQATDFLTFAVIVLLLGGVTLLANLVPARRATRIDPLTALRNG